MSDETPERKKRKPSKTPTARTLEYCRKHGWIAQCVEQTIPKMFIKRDLFGVIDIIAITPERQIIGIQATGDSVSGNVSTRKHKILAEPRALAWLLTGARLEVWGWGKRGAQGERKLWRLRVEPIAAEMFALPEAKAA